MRFSIWLNLALPFTIFLIFVTETLKSSQLAMGGILIPVHILLLFWVFDIIADHIVGSRDTEIVRRSVDMVFNRLADGTIEKALSEKKKEEKQ